MLTAAYALDALNDVERAGFERHLRSCGSCAVEMIEFQEVASQLSGRVALTPPDHMWARVMSEVSRTRQLAPAGRVPLRRPSVRRMLATVCAVVLIAGTAGLGGVVWRGHRAAQDAIVAADREAGRSVQVAAVLTDPERIEVAQPSTAGGSASVVAAGGITVLVVRDLSVPPSGMTYQVWLFDNRGVHSVELLELRDGSGQSLVVGAELGSRVAVSVEPAGGSTRPTTRPVLNMLVA